METKKLVYVIGTGRSGTTLLDIILGNNEGAISCGELNRYLMYEGALSPLENKPETHVFWESFKKALLEKFGGEVKFQYLFKIANKFEHHSGFIKRLLGIYNRKEMEDYLDFLKRFYETLFEFSDAKIFIESSKYPSRAYYLSEVMDCEMDFVNLKRSPAAVVRSFAKQDLEQPSQNWLKATIYYFLVSFLTWWVKKETIMKKNRNFVFIRYEDLISHPIQSIEKIEKALRLNLTRSKSIINKSGEFAVGNLYHGNRLRLEQNIKLQNTKGVKNVAFKYRISSIINYIWYP